MDSLNISYQNIVEQVLKNYADFLGTDDQVQIELVFDRQHDRYLLIEAGWQNGYRIYGTVLHFDIIDQKIWIQHDGTEEGVAEELVAAGVPKAQIVLAFKPLDSRKYMEFAIS
jgi:hypothetical protein